MSSLRYPLLRLAAGIPVELRHGSFGIHRSWRGDTSENVMQSARTAGRLQELP